ncbi:ABC transporter permease [Siphonobacter sp. SORGH_AS_0500]|uniref:ABC transporter permease n=1 Tax=Siphonobacter sp. SORGH_AS_0500 TaxID=1864824 RepID=UPI00285BFD76|nr:ABC transporter permease [Siphonobacter sp. SORGH_AS_0500]MDR6196071.1 putative ABC transport system permease protein [Siphonobacter sp. SORGH_AS_0500]
MLKNYFKIALRSLLKHRLFTIINLAGLSVGLVACLLISLYVRHELSYDTFHEKGNQIYRLVTDIKTPTETIHSNVTSAPMAPQLGERLPEIEAYTRLWKRNAVVAYKDQKFQENDLYLADSTVFNVFTFPLLKGDARTALKAPFSVVLTQKTAKKYFGEQDPMGQTLRMEGQFPVKVTGVLKDIPEASHIPFDLLLSMSTLTKHMQPGLDEQWGNFGFYSYFVLKGNTNPQALETKIRGEIDRLIGKAMSKDQMWYILHLEPLQELYLKSDRGAPQQGSLKNVYIFSVIAGFILVLACINFINLTIARASERAKEVGVRKVVGAGRQQLTFQFLSEYVLLSTFAFGLAVLLCELLLPSFNAFSGKTVLDSTFSNPTFWLILLGLALLVGVMAGLYPALVLSGMKAITVLKGRFATSRQGLILRKSLVVFQFVISVSLMVCTFVVYHQLAYMRQQSLGFSKDQMLILNLNDPQYMARHGATLKAQFSKIPGVESVTESSTVPGSGSLGAYTHLENQKGELQASNISLYSIDYNFFDQYQIPIIAGRSFSTKFSTDSTQALLVNEAAVRSLGYTSPEQIIGKKFDQWGRKGMIIGVVKNFHDVSLRDEISPASFRINPNEFQQISIKIKAQHIPETLAAVEQLWKQAVPERPFDYFFIDQSFNDKYKGEEQFGKLFIYFASIAIFIACLGLIGLTSYATFQRTKEIGVRKVLGASAWQVTTLLSKDFLKLVFIAVLIASPIAWYAMTRWLEDFHYRAAMPIWVFPLAGLLALGIALVTVSSLTIKAATANPVKSLKTE